MVALSAAWAGCFYGVADLVPSASGAAGQPAGGDAAGGNASGGTAGDGSLGGSNAAGSAGCTAADVDCEYRQRCDSSLIPRLFVSGQSGPYAIAADKTSVFWSDRDAMTPATGRIRRRDLSSGTNPVVTLDLATDQPDPSSIAIDANFVYWLTSDGNISRVNRDVGDGGAPPIDVIASDQHQPSGLVLDDGFVYWSSRMSPVISRREKAPPRAAVQVLATSEAKPNLLAEDATNVYWTTSSGFVESVAKAGGMPFELVTPTTLGTVLGIDSLSSFEAAGIAVDSDWVYFRARGLRVPPAKDDTGKLLRVRKDGSNLSVLVDNRAGGIAQLCIDSGKLYFTTGSSGGEVWRVASDGTGQVLMNCQVEAYPNGITTAGSRVYWTNLTGATVFWAPK